MQRPLEQGQASARSTGEDAAASATARGGGAVFAHRRRNGAHEALLRHAPEHGLSWAPLDWRPWPPAPGTDGCRQAEGEAVSGGVGAEHSVVVVLWCMFGRETPMENENRIFPAMLGNKCGMFNFQVRWTFPCPHPM